MAETAKDDVDKQRRGAEVVRLVPEGRPTAGVLQHPEDASSSATFYIEADGALTLTVNSAEGHFQQEDAEGPGERRLARLMLTLVARGYFNEAEHQEGLTVLWGTALDDLSTDGARQAASVVLHLMSSELIP